MKRRCNVHQEVNPFPVSEDLVGSGCGLGPLPSEEQLEGGRRLHRNVQRFRGGLVFKAHIDFVYHSTLGLTGLEEEEKVEDFHLDPMSRFWTWTDIPWRDFSRSANHQPS